MQLSSTFELFQYEKYNINELIILFESMVSYSIIILSFWCT